jgi:hypothetical protein
LGAFRCICAYLLNQDICSSFNGLTLSSFAEKARSMTVATAPTIDFAAMEQLTAQYKSLDASGSYEYSGFSVSISDVLAEISQGFSGGIVTFGISICVDTLLIDKDTVVFQSPGVSIVARSIQVTATNPCSMQVQFDGAIGFEIITQEITGPGLSAQILKPDGNPATDLLSIAVPSIASTLRPTPWLLRLSPDQPAAIYASSASAEIADDLFSPVALNALRASFVGATRLLYGTLDKQTVAYKMVTWVQACCADLISPNSTSVQLSAEDRQDMTDLQGQATSLLTILQYELGPAHYAPILSDTFYADQISGLLLAAKAYDNALTTLQQTTDLATTLQQFATTLKGISTDSETPLQNSLKRLVQQGEGYRRQYVTTLQLFQTQLQTVKSCRTTYESYMKEYEVWTALQLAFTILETTASFALACSGLAIPNPEQFLDVSDVAVEDGQGISRFVDVANQSFQTRIPLGTLAQGSDKFVKGLTVTGELANLGKSIMSWLPTGDLLATGNWKPDAIALPSSGTDELLLTSSLDSVQDLNSGKISAGLRSDFKSKASITLSTDSSLTITPTTVTNDAVTNPDGSAQSVTWWSLKDSGSAKTYCIWSTATELQVYDNNIFNKLLSDLKTLNLTDPNVDVSVVSVEGQDPTAYWNAYSLNAEGALQPAIDSGVNYVQPYLTAIKVLAEYGKAMGLQQQELMRLHGEALDVVARLYAVQQAEARWQALMDSITDEQQKRAAAESFLLRSYNDMKRSIFIAVENYRNAYRYNWLTEPPLKISLDMNYAQIQTQCSLAAAGLESVLQATAGSEIKPAKQDFNAPVEVVIPLSQAEDYAGKPYFDSQGTVSWVIKGLDTLMAKISTSSDPVTVADYFPGLPAIYIESVMFYLDGVKPNPHTNEVWTEVHTSGNYFHRLGAEGLFHFVSPEFGMDCSYVLSSTGTITPNVYWMPSRQTEGLYMKPSPYTTWTLKVTDGDWSGVTQIRMAFTGYYLHEST